MIGGSSLHKLFSEGTTSCIICLIHIYRYMVPWVDLLSVIMAIPGHTRSFLTQMIKLYLIQLSLCRWIVSYLILSFCKNIKPVYVCKQKRV